MLQNRVSWRTDHVGNGLLQNGLDATRGVSQFTPGLLYRKRRRPTSNPDPLDCRRGCTSRHVVSLQLYHPCRQFRESAGNRNHEPATAGGCRHERKYLPKRHVVAAEKVAMTDPSLFHRKNEADRNIPHIDKVQDKIEIQLKSPVFEKVPKHGGGWRRIVIL